MPPQVSGEKAVSDDSPLPSDVLKQSNGDLISFGGFFLEYGSRVIDLAALFRFRGAHEKCPVALDLQMGHDEDHVPVDLVLKESPDRIEDGGSFD
jgi:hypothetical protein